MTAPRTGRIAAIRADLSPRNSIPFPCIAKRDRHAVGIPGASMEHGNTTGGIVRHGIIRTRRRPARRLKGPGSTAPFPGVAAEDASDIPAEEHHDLAAAVVNHFRAVSGARAGGGGGPETPDRAA